MPGGSRLQTRRATPARARDSRDVSRLGGHKSPSRQNTSTILTDCASTPADLVQSVAIRAPPDSRVLAHNVRNTGHVAPADTGVSTTTTELLHRLEQLHIQVSLDGERLRCRAPKGA